MTYNSLCCASIALSSVGSRKIPSTSWETTGAFGGTSGSPILALSMQFCVLWRWTENQPLGPGWMLTLQEAGSPSGRESPCFQNLSRSPVQALVCFCLTHAGRILLFSKHTETRGEPGNLTQGELRPAGGAAAAPSPHDACLRKPSYIRCSH